MTRLTDERLTALNEGEGMGGERTARARVIRELIDEIRQLRAELAESPSRRGDTLRPSGGRLTYGDGCSSWYLNPSMRPSVQRPSTL